MRKYRPLGAVLPHDAIKLSADDTEPMMLDILENSEEYLFARLSRKRPNNSLQKRDYDTYTESVSAVAQQIIHPGSEIHSDALGSFRAALQGAYVHHYQVFDKDSGALRWVHILISNVKSFLLGTYHGIGKKHLQSCFDEFAFRFNRRFWPDQLFPRLVCAVTSSHILGYGGLTR